MRVAITRALEAEFHGLLTLSAAETLREFWRSARRVLNATLPLAGIWFAPDAECALERALLREPMASKQSTDAQRFWSMHPLQPFLCGHPERRIAKLSDVVEEKQLLKTQFYRKFMAPQQERFSVVLGFFCEGKLRSVIGLSRLRSDSDFSRNELRRLGWMHGQLEGALGRVWALQRERATQQALGLALAPAPTPLALIDWNLTVLYSNQAANEMARLWQIPSGDRQHLMAAPSMALPHEVRRSCEQLKAQWIDGGEAVSKGGRGKAALLVPARANGLCAHVRVLEFPAFNQGRPLFVVRFEQSDPVSIVAASESLRLSQLSRLSVREREVASLVSRGQSNKEVAAYLGKSVLTVKAQLQSIYRKLGTVGRGRLIAVLQEH